MDRITQFRQAVLSVIEDYIAEFTKQTSLNDVQFEPIIDNENQRFQLLTVGWHNSQRIHSLIFHMDIINDKIWIQNDNLEYSVAERLVDRGISKKDIVLAYFSPAHRVFTEYAAV
jgi:XisI protein